MPFAEALSRDFAVYLWDMPGYGQSSKRPADAVDLGTQAELLSDLLSHWDLPAPHVVAHDFGGAVSLRAHLLHGVPCASLALVDVVALRRGAPTSSGSSAKTSTSSPPSLRASIGPHSRSTSPAPVIMGCRRRR